MSDCVDCDKCEELLQRFLDRDLTDSERVEAETHLKACGYCNARYRFEESLRRFVHQAASSERCPDALKQKLAQLAREA
jgi:anti-sigma factor (TIGR02949 family)